MVFLFSIAYQKKKNKKKMSSNKRKSKAPEHSSYTFEREESPDSLASASASTSTSISSSANTSESNTSNRINSGGRVLAPVWEYFHREKTNSHGHYSAKCSFCSTKWARGEQLKLEAHLAL